MTITQAPTDFVQVMPPVPPRTGTSYLERMLRKLNRDVHDLKNGQDTGWIFPTLLNSWTQYNVADWPMAYRRVNGIVYLRGLITKTSGSTDDIMFNLPTGFRPAENGIFSGVTPGGHVSSWHVDIYVLSNGDVYNNSGTASATWVSLSNINFPVG